MIMKNFYETVKEALRYEPKSCSVFIMSNAKGNVVCVNYFDNPFIHFSNLDWMMYEESIKIADIKPNNDVHIYLK